MTIEVSKLGITPKSIRFVRLFMKKKFLGDDGKFEKCGTDEAWLKFFAIYSGTKFFSGSAKRRFKEVECKSMLVT